MFTSFLDLLILLQTLLLLLHFLLCPKALSIVRLRVLWLLARGKQRVFQPIEIDDLGGLLTTSFAD